MGQKYVKYTKEFRETALRRLGLSPNVAQLCRELGISRQLLYSWRVSRIVLCRCHCARAGSGLAESRDLCAGSLQKIHFQRLLRQRFLQLKVLLAKPLFGTRSLLLFVSMPAMVSHPCRDETASWMGHLEFQ